jgi:hypothetical protein
MLYTCFYREHRGESLPLGRSVTIGPLARGATGVTREYLELVVPNGLLEDAEEVVLEVVGIREGTHVYHIKYNVRTCSNGWRGPDGVKTWANLRQALPQIEVTELQLRVSQAKSKITSEEIMWGYELRSTLRNWLFQIGVDLYVYTVLSMACLVMGATPNVAWRLVRRIRSAL